MSTSESTPILEKPRNAELIQKHPEVIANPPLEHLKSVISIPTYHGEWKNGVLVRNLISVLSQNLHSNEALEVNYIFNMNGDLPAFVDTFDNEIPVWKKLPADDPYWEKRKVGDEAVAFLKKVVAVQGHLESVQQMIDSVTDPLQKKVLELASQNTNKVAISVVNALDVPMSQIGYHDRLSGYRTMGMDFAEERLGEDGVFLLFDTDAVPQDNQFAHDLNALFTSNPDTKYALLRIGYQPTGTSKQMVETSPLVTLHGTNGYSTSEYTQTTQMAFRKEVFGQLKEVMDLMYNHNFHSSRPGEEDRDTAMRLIGLYADMIDGMMFQIDHSVNTMPVSLVEDRVDGLFDGAGREGSLKNQVVDHDQQIVEMTKLLKEAQDLVQGFMDKLSDEKIKTQLQAELVVVQKEFLRKQTRNLRLNRVVAKDFIKLMDLGDERIGVGKKEWIYDPDIRKVIAKLPSGTALLAYLNRNSELISQLTNEDLDVMRYCVTPTDPRPEVMNRLTDFQKVMIEYLGYVETETGSQVPQELRSTLQSMLAEVMAYSHIFSLYQVSKEFYREEGVEKFIIESDKRKKEDIKNYQAVQDMRDKSWVAKPVEKVADSVTTSLDSTTIMRKLIDKISPRFSFFVKKLSKK